MAFKIKGSIAVVKDVTAGGNLQTGTAGLVKLTDSGGTNTVSLQAPTSVSSSYTLKLPTADGTSGYSLTTNGAGQLQFSNVSGGGGGGTVTSVGLTAPSIFTSPVSGSPVTGSGTLALTFATGQTANQVLASPDGTTGAVGLRALTATDIPALPESKITNLVTDLAAKLNLAGGTMTGALTLFSDPVSPLHAATKQYVDAFAVGLDFKQSVRVATTANITLAGNQTIDGVVTNTNDRVLVKNQSSALQNGIYCVDTETEILTKDGWKSYDEVKTGDIALTFNLNSGLSEWQPIQGVHIFDEKEYDMYSMNMESHSSLTTLNHRWPVKRDAREHASMNRERNSTGQFIKDKPASKEFFRIVESQNLTGDDYIIRATKQADYPTVKTHSDELVEAIAWFYTEGNIRKNNSGTMSTCVRIVQSDDVNPKYVEDIDNCLTKLFGPKAEKLKGGGYTTPQWRVSHRKTGMAVFDLNSAAGKILLAAAPNKIPSFEFITNLTENQLELFYRKSIDADGCRSGGKETFKQKDEGRLDAFLLTCHLLGKATTVKYIPHKDYRTVHVVAKTRYTKPQRFSTLEKYLGQVWCPTTENSTWFARREDSYYFTGNTAAGGAWARSVDADSAGEVTSGMYTFVEEGTVNGDTGWVLTTNNPITLDTTALTFVQFTGTGQISAGTGITITGNQIGINTSVVPTNSSNLSFFAATSSAQLATLLSDKTGTGVNVFATSPTLVTPNIGVATATSVNGLGITSSTGTLTIANGKTLTNNNTLTFTGTDSSSVAFGTGGTVVYTSNNLSVHAATTSAQLAGVINDETGTGLLVFNNTPALTTPAIGSGGFTIAGSSSGVTTINTSAAASGTITIPAGTDTLVGVALAQTLTNKTLTSPTLTTPVLGTPSSGTLTNCTGLPIATGISGLGTGVATFLATPSSANLFSALTTKTGNTSSIVFADSPTFTGTPAAPTAAAGTNTTQVATTAFVTSANTKSVTSFTIGGGSWGTAAGGFYTITVTAGTHGKGTSPDVRIEESSGADWVHTFVDQEIVRSTGNVEIKVSDSPDGRFDGRILIY